MIARLTGYGLPEGAAARPRLRTRAIAALRRGSSRAADELAAAHVELARRQSFTDALLETVDVGIVSCDANGVFVVSNRAEREIFGFQTGLAGLPVDDLESRIDVFDRDGRRLGADEYPLMRALRGEDVAELQVLAGPAGGPYRELVVRGRQITDHDGGVLGAVAALTDVTAERTAVRALAEEHRKLTEAHRLGKLGSFEHDFATGSWAFSEYVSVLWGLDPRNVSAEMVYGCIAAEDQPTVEQVWSTACREGGTYTCDLRIRRLSDHAERLIRCNIEVELDRQRRPVRGRGTHLDITDVTAAEKAAQRANAFMTAILAATPDFTLVTDVATNSVIYGSPGKGLLGLTSAQIAELGPDGMLALAHPEDRERVREMTAAVAGIDDGQVLQVQYRGRRADGEWRWLSHRLTPFRWDASGAVVEVLAVVRDVTDLVDAEQRLIRAVQHDYLTGLPNRALLIERLDAALIRSVGERREVAVLFCDLDGFKGVNDAGGHSAGDAVLIETARRLIAVVRDEDTVARVGGDEFVVVVEPWNRSMHGEDLHGFEPSARTLAAHLAVRLTEALRRPVTFNGVDYVVTASIGIAYARLDQAPNGDRAMSADAILHRADNAMYRAKENGKDRFEEFEEEERSTSLPA